MKTQNKSDSQSKVPQEGLAMSIFILSQATNLAEKNISEFRFIAGEIIQINCCDFISE
ncbi:MAG: hypothetical protein ACOVRK_06685 [Chryseobacterium taeanense]